MATSDAFPVLSTITSSAAVPSIDGGTKSFPPAPKRPIAPPAGPATRVHLYAAGLALSLAALCVALGLLECRELERHYIHELAPEFYDVKLQGVALQKEAFAHPDLLVLYGSSELVKEMPNNATQFFQNEPTGFSIFPVGKPGATSLSALMKVAAVGKELSGKKVAFSISPGWFFTKEVDPKYYEGNFSELQAMEFAFHSPLSWDLKRDIARRMLAYPKTLARRQILRFSLARLAGDSLLDRLGYFIVWPLGALNTAIARAQDHLEVAIHVVDEDDRLEKLSARPRLAGTVNWNDVLKKAARFVNSTALQAKRSEVVKRRQRRVSRDPHFAQTVASATEWTDIELLMRAFNELKAKPLFLSMPIEDIRLEAYGVTPEARTEYIERLDGLAHSHAIALRDFHQFQKDPAFNIDFLDHLSGEGWLYYNQALDDFYHSR